MCLASHKFVLLNCHVYFIPIVSSFDLFRKTWPTVWSRKLWTKSFWTVGGHFNLVKLAIGNEEEARNTLMNGGISNYFAASLFRYPSYVGKRKTVLGPNPKRTKWMRRGIRTPLRFKKETNCERSKVWQGNLFDIGSNIPFDWWNPRQRFASFHVAKKIKEGGNVLRRRWFPQKAAKSVDLHANWRSVMPNSLEVKVFYKRSIERCARTNPDADKTI